MHFSLAVLAAAAATVDASAAKCNVCPFTPGSVCCNATIHQVCPGGVECCNCGADTCECPAAPKQNIVELASATKDLSTLVTALKAGDLVKTLSGPGPFTVFAPTNEAFAALPAAVLSALLKPENKADLVKVLTYHVAFPELHSDQLKNGEKIMTLEGQNLTISISKSVKINNATVTSADNDASNGVVHIIDQVLLYPGFAPPAPPAPPTPAPPAPVPPVPGCPVCPYTPGSVCCNQTSHQGCPGGVECCDCGAEACQCPPAPTKNIVELAVATKDLSTLVEALKAGDLVTTLSGPGPFTVFAPTNEAFAALPPGVLAGLLKPENKAQLVKVLTYHVAFPELHADQLKNGEKIVTLEGQNVTVSISGKSVKINNATVTAADNDASNGVVHIINAVLLPA